MSDKVAPYGISSLVTGTPATRRYKVQTPNHGVIEIEGPEGASDDVLKAVAARDLQARYPKEKFAAPVVNRTPPDRSGVVSGIDSVARSAINGYTGGLADHFSAGMNAILPVDNLVGGDASSIWQGKNPLQAYRENVVKQHAIDTQDNANHPYADGVAQVGGAIASPFSRVIPGGGAMKGIANSGLYGAIFGGASADPGKEDAGAASSALSGIAGDVLGRGTVAALGRVAAPLTSKAVRTAREYGIPLTVGRLIPQLRGLEDKVMGTIPGLGDLVRNRVTKSIEASNRAAIDDVLSPISQKLPKSVNVGRDAAKYGQDVASQAYDNALGSLRVTPDAKFVADLSGAEAAARKLTGAPLEHFMNVMQADVKPFLTGAAITGKELQALKRGLDKQISALSGGKASPADALALKPLEAAREAIMASAERQNPKLFGDYLNADAAYSGMQRINDATARMRADKAFSPLALAGSVAKRGYGTTTAKVARGDARLQGLSDAVAELLPSSVPDSGTAGRLGIAALLGGGGLAAAFAPKTVAALGGASLPYAPGIDKALEVLIAGERPAAVKAVGRALRRTAPVVGAVAGPLAVQQRQGR